MSDIGYNVTGIDISQEVINQVIYLSKQKGYNIPFYLYEGHKFSHSNASFDIVIIWAQTFGTKDLVAFAQSDGFDQILCDKGEIYKPEDGTVLYYII